MSSPKKIKRAVINRAHIELVVVLIADVILYFKMQNASFYNGGLLWMFLSAIAFLMTIAGIVSLIAEANTWIEKQNNKPTSIQKIYWYLKIFLGILFVILGFYLLLAMIFDGSFPSDIGSYIWGVIFAGFFLRIRSVFVSVSYLKLKELHPNESASEEETLDNPSNIP